MVSDEDVTEIDGVGSGTADNLVDAGFETVSDVAEATVNELSEVKGFGEVKADETIDEAESMLEESSSGESDETVDDPWDDDDEFVESDDEDDSDDEFSLDEAMGEDEETYDVLLDVDHNVGYHLIHIVLEEATSQQQSSDVPLRDRAYELSEKLMRELLHNEEGTILNVRLSLTENELNAFYRALNQGSLDYSSRPGINEIYGDFESIKSAVNEQRKKAREN